MWQKLKKWWLNGYYGEPMWVGIKDFIRLILCGLLFIGMTTFLMGFLGIVIMIIVFQIPGLWHN